MNIGILGLGEVGQAIKKLCLKKHRVFARDLKLDEFKDKKIDILHVCIPYSKNFEKIVIRSCCFSVYFARFSHPFLSSPCSLYIQLLSAQS